MLSFPSVRNTRDFTFILDTGVLTILFTDGNATRHEINMLPSAVVGLRELLEDPQEYIAEVKDEYE
jgi:hypothetical protein